ncbi:hypothetical protein O4J56_14785 [Nocardiopsis sp. RSe5-2]|uniref:Uncharacterized protein n=1 Tax=Nocardiopsis endophytica TaxID=3018445 RepID=A0ABT4U4N3_9ACTN|nr:hypothetical protein [Nocardiopsis endophytica]MDA2811907.1 hypothetical protein [Nocardiopsis endophytica]
MYSTDHLTAVPPGLPPGLAHAFAADPPGEARPPGPRVNPWGAAGAVPVAVPGRLGDLLGGLWSGEGFHRLEDGTPTNVRRRPVPSAGGAYPVQTHVVVGASGARGDGGGSLEPGRYVYDHDRDTLLRRADVDSYTDTDTDTGAGADGAVGPGAGTHVVLTVQPGRSYGRYRHRAWPLWIADTAYALAAVEFLTRASSVRLGPGAPLRGLLGVPRAAEHEWWTRRGLAPEIPLASIELPDTWSVDAGRREALAARRSPAIGEFAAAARARLCVVGSAARVPETRGAVEACEQAWVLGAHRLETWSVPVDASTAAVAEVLWRAHREAAHLCYSSALTGEWRCRPVSGFRAVQGRWTVHAVAMLPGSAECGVTGPGTRSAEEVA